MLTRIVLAGTGKEDYIVVDPQAADELTKDFQDFIDGGKKTGGNYLCVPRDKNGHLIITVRFEHVAALLIGEGDPVAVKPQDKSLRGDP